MGDLLDYPLLLEHMYAGYFATGRHSAKRAPAQLRFVGR